MSAPLALSPADIVDPGGIGLLAEIAYFFAAIVVGLVTAIDLGGAGATAALAALVLGAPAIVDQPGLLG